MNYSLSVFLILLVTLIGVAKAQPMTNEEDTAALVSHDAGEKVRESPHMVIAPRKPKLLSEQQSETGEAETLRPDVYDTIVELQAGGVQMAEKRQLQTLSYKELNRLLALWHLTQRRNYYDANGNRAPPVFEENDEEVKPLLNRESQ